MNCDSDTNVIKLFTDYRNKLLNKIIINLNKFQNGVFTIVK